MIDKDTTEAMEQAPLPEVDGLTDKSKTFEYYQKVFTDPELEGLDYLKVQELYNTGAIKGPKFKSLVGKLDKAATSMKEVMDIKTYAEDPNQLKSPYNAEDRRRIDVAYSTRPLQISNPTEYNKAVERVKSYGGIIPKQMRRQLEAMIINGEPLQQVYSAQMIRDMERSNPGVRVGQNLSSDVFHRADFINLLNYKGADLNNVIETANNYLKPMDSATKERLTKDAHNVLARENISKRIESSELGATSPMVEEAYKKVYEALYRGDDDTAHQLAIRNIESKFAKTAFGFKQKVVMEITPERVAQVYGAPNPEMYVRYDLEEFLKSRNLRVVEPDLINRFWFGNNPQVHEEEAFLVEDDRTGLDSSFRVKKLDPELQVPVDVIGPDKKPLRYSVSKPDDFKKVLEKRNARVLEEEKVNRQKLIEEQDRYRNAPVPGAGSVTGMGKW